MNQQETLYAIALSRVNYFGLSGMAELYRRLGSATAVMEHRRDIRAVMPDATDRLVNVLAQLDEPLRRAEEEMAFNDRQGIAALTLNDARYPRRLAECPDAPIVLFFKGNADLNAQRIISIVGTRHCTVYGQDLIRRLVAGLAASCPGVLIVSGLAYGVDICAHNEALANTLPTVGVLAHGLDYLYPPRHKPTADRMLTQGGLITEFLTHTNADKMNFVRRNRIVAGMADATILVESAAHGGGLITAGLARDYNRDVFAFPGNVGQTYSEGCNNLIRDNGAQLITSADEVVKALGWQTDSMLNDARKKGIERQLFPDLTPDERRIVDILSRQGDLQINILTVQSGLPIATLSATLFSLEMKGIVKMYVGGCYHLLT